MPSQEYPSLNGIVPSWADISVTAALHDGPLVELFDIASINWGRSVEVGQKMSGGRVVARTTGSESSESSMTLYRDGHLKFLRALASVAPSRGSQKRVSLVGFDIAIQHSPPGGGSEIYQTIIKGCRYLGDSSDNSEGTDAEKVEITLSPIVIVSIIDGEEVVLL